MDTIAAHNDTILIAAGAYSIPDGGLTAPAKSLTLQAAGEVLYTCSGFGPGFSINTAVRMSGFTISNCTAGDSGGIHIYSTSAVVIESVIVEKCHGGTGGGIRISDGAKAVFHNVTVRNNSAAGAGGVFVTGDATEATFTQSSITGNLGTTGGLRVQSGARVNCTQTLIADNVANIFGGGVSIISTANSTFNQCNITRNVAHNEGGGVNLQGHADTASSSFINCHIDNNVAAIGGGVYSVNVGAQPIFIGCTINENVALDTQMGGGAGWISKVVCCLQACGFLSGLISASCL